MSRPSHSSRRHAAGGHPPGVQPRPPWPSPRRRASPHAPLATRPLSSPLQPAAAPRWLVCSGSKVCYRHVDVLFRCCCMQMAGAVRVPYESFRACFLTCTSFSLAAARESARPRACASAAAAVAVAAEVASSFASSTCTCRDQCCSAVSGARTVQDSRKATSRCTARASILAELLLTVSPRNQPPAVALLCQAPRIPLPVLPQPLQALRPRAAR